jgi:hypothetical protein
MLVSRLLLAAAITTIIVSVPLKQELTAALGIVTVSFLFARRLSESHAT